MSLTSQQITKRIGTEAALTLSAIIPGGLRLEGSYTLTVGVIVLDARSNYGRVDYLVKPVIGSGEAWVSETRLGFQFTK